MTLCTVDMTRIYEYERSHILNTQLIPLPCPLGGIAGGLSPLEEDRRRPVDTFDADRPRPKEATGASLDTERDLVAIVALSNL